MLSIQTAFPISTTEYQQLENKFGDLVHYVAWQLRRKNVQNNVTDELDDIEQELRISILRAGSYYKRQTYIEECFKIIRPYLKDRFLRRLIKQLEKLWLRRTHHGANKQKFGDYQQELLETIIQHYVPLSHQPRRDNQLQIDQKFTTYCKSITWNCQKNLGKRITKERALRSGLVSLNEHDHICNLEKDID